MPNLFQAKINSSLVFTDALLKYTVSNVGGTTINDSTSGSTRVLKLGTANGNQIRVADLTTTNFSGGITIALKVLFETNFTGEYFIYKDGSFLISILNSKLLVQSLSFPTEVIEGVVSPKFTRYPIDVDYYPGRTPIELNVWTTILITYDQTTGELLVRLNGKEDIRIHRFRGGEQLSNNIANSFRFFEGFKNVRVAYINVTSGRPGLIKATCRSQCFYDHASDSYNFFFDKIDTSVAVPFEVTISREFTSSDNAVVLNKTIRTTRTSFTINIPASTFGSKPILFMVEVTAAAVPIHVNSFVKVRRLNTSNYQLDSNKRLTKAGTPIFPLGIYHAIASDFSELKTYGINLIYNGLNIRSRHSGVHPNLQLTLSQCLTSANNLDIGLISEADGHSPNLANLVTAKDSLACAGMYLVDEPTTGQYRLLEASSAITKLEDPKGFLSFMSMHKMERVTINSQNADILLIDVYPIPNISLRMVGDSIRRSREAIGDHIPIWYVIPCYHYLSEIKVPTVTQFKAMSIIAVCAGARGLMAYTWDDRQPVGSTNAVSGYYTKDFPSNRAVLEEGFTFLSSISSILIKPRASVQPTLVAASPSIWFAVLEGSGVRHLLVANDAEVSKTFSLKFAGTFTGVVTASTGSNVNSTAGVVPITLTSHGIAIYTLPSGL